MPYNVCPAATPGCKPDTFSGVSIDYQRMARVRKAQKSALTRAIRSGSFERVVSVCRDAVREWDIIGAWPDDWSRWQRALNDTRHYDDPFLSLEDLREI